MRSRPVALELAFRHLKLERGHHRLRVDLFESIFDLPQQLKEPIGADGFTVGRLRFDAFVELLVGAVK